MLSYTLRGNDPRYRSLITELNRWAGDLPSGYRASTISVHETDEGITDDVVRDIKIVVAKTGLSPLWSKGLFVTSATKNADTIELFLRNGANNAGLPGGASAGTTSSSSWKEGVSTSLSPPATASAPGWKCTTKVCYSVNSKPWQQIFEDLQKNLNKVGGSAGFAPLKVDGILGNGTVAAWNKAAAWLKSKGMTGAAGFSTKEKLAVSAVGINTMLFAAIATYSPKAAVKPPGYSPPPEGAVPAGDVADNNASKTPKWPYYLAAGAGGLLILGIAYQFSRRGPRVVALP